MSVKVNNLRVINACKACLKIYSALEPNWIGHFSAQDDLSVERSLRRLDVKMFEHR